MPYNKQYKKKKKIPYYLYKRKYGKAPRFRRRSRLQRGVDALAKNVAWSKDKPVLRKYRPRLTYKQYEHGPERTYQNYIKTNVARSNFRRLRNAAIRTQKRYRANKGIQRIFYKYKSANTRRNYLNPNYVPQWVLDAYSDSSPSKSESPPSWFGGKYSPSK